MPLPEGYTIEKPSTANLPTGYTLEGPTPASSVTPQAPTRDIPRLKGTPSGMPDTFMGTLASDFANVPASIYSIARHPIDTAISMGRSALNLPSDLYTDISQGNWGKLGARASELALPFATGERLATIGDVAGGVAKGAYEGATTPTALKIRYHGLPVELPQVPASVAGAGAGLGAGRILGGLAGHPQAGEAIGGAVGAAIPAVKGAIQGGRAAYRGEVYPAPPAIEPVVPQAPVPFKPSQTTSRLLSRRATGGTPPLQPLPTPSTSWEVPEGPFTLGGGDIVPQAPEPTRPNPNISRLISRRATGGAGGGTRISGVGVRRGINRAVEVQPPEEAGGISPVAPTATPAVPTAAPSGTGFRTPEGAEHIIPAQQRFAEVSGDYMHTKNTAAGEQAFQEGLTPEQIRGMSKDKLDSLLLRTYNPRTGNRYTATQEKAKGMGRSYADIKEHVALALEDVLKKAGK